MIILLLSIARGFFWIWDKKEDISVFFTWLWVQAAFLFDKGVLPDGSKTDTERVWFIISWLGGAAYLWYRVGSQRAEKIRKEAETRKEGAETKKLEAETKKLEAETERIELDLEMIRIENKELPKAINEIRKGVRETLENHKKETNDKITKP